MNTYLARISECVHGYTDCPGGTTTRIDVDYEAAWDLYYVMADRRNKGGLTANQLIEVVDAALGGTES